MKPEELIALLVANLARQIDWIKIADTKANFVFAFLAAIAGFSAAVIPKTEISWDWGSGISGFTSAGLYFYSFVYVFMTLRPDTKGPVSHIFCGGIADQTFESFLTAMRTHRNEEYIQDLCAQVHRNAQIAIRKFRCVKKAMFGLIALIPFWVTALWLLRS